MEQRRINLADIVSGQALPWDITDLAGHLLLRQGQIVHSGLQIERLIERGLFISGTAGPSKKENPPVVKPEQASALRIINQAIKRLERLLFNIGNETEVQSKIIEVAKAIRYAVSINSDVAVATILLNQDVGEYAVRHCIDTAILVAHVGNQNGKSEAELVSVTAAALTMNLGMLREHGHLQTNGNQLTDGERKVIYRHPAESVRLLREAGVKDEDWLNCILQHHENEDGSGYSSGKRGGEMMSNAKLLMLTDRYCARVVARTYRKKMLPNAALRDILLNEKNKIDALLAASFLRELGIYPCGTFVKLENGEVGVVTSQGVSSTTPIVHALLGPHGAPLAFPIKRDTARALTKIREVLHADAASVRFNMHQLWGSDANL
ncbi:HD domain-containing phosphohydrolase [Actimicrobium sp. CCC2.4]|uniref:HD-GYP domain-containing protein n=1 Tax=Actimicrobium sp. CCC2.4 TaxID=3048606 RepID=UPI002AC95AF9|nr:HD domain-containing phosphohydrolase [Actimicrobium sp. CCC2.4]MEB0134852.1 HD domain-containing phosphohydrolase [Actimicrobium sp. CCC2.4]WPX30784.1 HD domain-containing phosphohydrolase [Actimicrobium sp. CCC2.4]